MGNSYGGDELFRSWVKNEAFIGKMFLREHLSPIVLSEVGKSDCFHIVTFQISNKTCLPQAHSRKNWYVSDSILFL